MSQFTVLCDLFSSLINIISQLDLITELHLQQNKSVDFLLHFVINNLGVSNFTKSSVLITFFTFCLVEYQC